MTKFAIAFPGQGSQSVGMLAELAAEYPVVKATFDEASQVLGYDLFQLVMNGPAEELNKTWRTQPALLTSSVALWRVWQSLSAPVPAMMAGHSLGEYSALVCSGALAFADAVKLVELRGLAMQEAVPEGVGAMAAIIGLDIAGHKEAVERANVLMKESGAKRALPLPVSVPSHCALMKPAAEKLAQALQSIEITAPAISVINNVDVSTETDAARIKDALVRQLFSPVRWTETIEAVANAGVEFEVEMGPGKVLSGLVKRIDKRVDGAAINDPASLQDILAKLQ
ncbi:MAG: ACP S-malonyltransferase [Aeromonadaceae bacterium]